MLKVQGLKKLQPGMLSRLENRVALVMITYCKHIFFKSIVLLLFLLHTHVAFAQVRDELILRFDTLEYRSTMQTRMYRDEPVMFFPSPGALTTAEVRFKADDPQRYSAVALLPGGDFELIDPLVKLENGYWRTKVRFSALGPASIPSLIFRIVEGDSRVFNREYKLFPYLVPRVGFEGEAPEIFEGEEKTIELQSRFPQEVSLAEGWQEINKVEYRIVREGSRLLLRLKPKANGKVELSIPLQSNRPFVNDSARITRTMAPLQLTLSIKPSRLQFVNPDKALIFFQLDGRNSDEITIPYNPALQLRQLYRIENQIEGTGRLIAELIPKSIIGDRMLCDVITYALHATNEGYLYIKDKGKSIFVTNFNIANRPRIERMKLLREGEDWTDNLRVYPGDKVELRIEGSGLLMADIQFEGCVSRRDSLRRSSQTVFYQVDIPKDIQRRRVSVFMNQVITPYELVIQEHQNPTTLDFVVLNVDGEAWPMSSDHFDKSVFYPKTMRALTIHFDGSKIDENGDLFGRQFVDVEIKIVGPRNELLDVQRMTNVAVCPGENSMRQPYYDQRSCFNGVINLNDLLLRKTYDLDPFSQVIVTVNHTPTRYNVNGYTRKATFVMERVYNYDIQISFPAGLLVKNFGEANVGNLSGISTAAIAQWSWYDPDHIGKFKPFKAGVGFIAFNAFNFSNSTGIERDVGIVALGSFEPVKADRRIALPLYFGFGYKLNKNDLFVLLGPGLQVRF
jgi:hypothetical protein